MIKLTPMQLSILAAADAREDGGLSRPAALRPAAATKASAKLIAEKLVREVRAKGNLPMWREDGTGRAYSLTILKAGRILVRDAAERNAENTATSSIEGVARSTVAPAAEAATTRTLKQESAVLGRRGSKRALVISMLQQPNGASMVDLIAATGWLPHTTRAALTGLRKGGLTVERHRDAETEGSVYRIAPTNAEAA